MEAPRLQPDVTAHDTTGAQPLRMGGDQGHSEPAGDEEEAAGLPDLKPWRQAGWIFRDGECVAIERQGDELERRLRVLAD
jgi:hypothetical protein